jgi:glycosyltransferase involved in cell wall biosynthesis
MSRIVVSVINDLVTDQRVHRICNTLHNNGFEVLLVGRKLKTSIDLQRDYETHRMELVFTKGFLFYAFFNIRLFFFLLFKKVDILLSNDLDTLAANYFVSKLRNKKLVFDSHEYFPEVPELIDRKNVQNFWLRIEKAIIPKLKFAYTVSPSIGELYQQKYNVNFQIIRNLPSSSDNKEFFKFEDKTILYQGALNVGRGIELIIESMKLLPEYKLLIIGDGDISKELKDLTTKFELNSQVQFLGRLPIEELKLVTGKAHLGVSLEEDRGLNYRFALPNKLFDYIQAEIPVVVSDLPEMKAIVEEYHVGEILKERTAENLAELIVNIVNDKEKYKFYSKNLKEAAKNLCWEIEEKKLIDLFDKIKKI